MNKILITILLFISAIGVAQDNYYSPPVKIPLLLSGSFAELRTNHFHSGIDIKTQGVTGIPVSAAAEGYISRISVSPGGYGNALYINHPNGTTTAYGHLKEFRDDIQKYIRDIQYNLKSFRVDIQIPPHIFPVEKDEWIALSGNSGSSGGPHLHFEIRNTRTEKPLNPLEYGFNIIDKTAPTISGLLVTPLDNNSHVDFNLNKKFYPVVFYDGKYHLTNNPTITVGGKIGFAFEAYDYFDGSPNKCGLSKIQLKIDGEIYFSMDLNRFSFDETRYINSFIDYETFVSQKRKFQKTYIDPGNKLSMYVLNKNNGIYESTDDEIHTIDIETVDAYGNLSVLTFNIKGAPQNTTVKQTNSNLHFSWDKPNSFVTNDAELHIPVGNLYCSFDFTYRKLPAKPGVLSEIHELGENIVSLFNGAHLRIKEDNLESKWEEKALIVSIDPNTGKHSATGGEFENGWVSAEINKLGQYAVTVDSVAPTIKALSITNHNTLTERDRIRFRINDDLSGINKIEGFIDGKWALFEYDQKNNLITHYFDNERFELNKQHHFELKVSDYKSNTTSYTATFYR